MPASIASAEMSSARWRLRMTRFLSAFAHGASVKPQLPITTLVMPCQQEEVPSGSQKTCASMWVWPSTKPGDTTRPSASMTSRADSRMRPMVAMRPSLTPTSARYRGSPEPSTTQPFLITRSKDINRFLPIQSLGHRSLRGWLMVPHLRAYSRGLEWALTWPRGAPRLRERRHGHRDLRPSRPAGHAARARPLSRHLYRGGDPAHPTHPSGSLRLLPASLRPAPAHRGSVHARSALARALRLRRGAGHRPLRDGVLQPPPPRDGGDLQGRARGDPPGAAERGARASRPALHLPQGAHDPAPVQEAEPAPLVWTEPYGGRGMGGGQQGARPRQWSV